MTKIPCFFIAAVGYSSVAMAATQTAALNVPELKCSSCPVTLKKALMKIERVEQVMNNFEKREGVVNFVGNKTDIEKRILATASAEYRSTQKAEQKAENSSTFAYGSAKLAAALESLSTETFPQWKEKAQAGDPLARNILGMAYKYRK